MTPTSGDIAEVINAVAQLLMVFVVGVGVWVAYSQLEASRIERQRQRRAELAEEMIVIANQVLDAFKYMRNPFVSIPPEKIHDKEFMYGKRYERVAESSDLFGKLREFQIRVDAVIGLPATQRHVTELFNARTEVAMAIEELVDIEGKAKEDRYPDEAKAARYTLYGSWSDRDEFGRKIMSAIDGIVTSVSPYARIQGAKP